MSLRCGRVSFSADHNALRCEEPRFQRTRMKCALPQFETALFKTASFETKATTEKVGQHCYLAFSSFDASSG